MTDGCNEEGTHRDLRRREIQKSESAVQATVDALNSFVNPFTVSDKDHLYTISSGQKVPDDVETDVTSAESLGRKSKMLFIDQRLKSEETGFFEPVKRLKLKTMSSTDKKTSFTNKQKKIVELKQQGNVAFQLLVKSQNLNMNIDLRNVMKYQLTPIPYCLGTSDGYLAKTNKAKGFHHITKDSEDAIRPPPDVTLLIVDGNSIFHGLTDLPDNFKDISQKIFKAIPCAGDVIFSTDTYNKGSIKAMELEKNC